MNLTFQSVLLIVLMMLNACAGINKVPHDAQLKSPPIKVVGKGMPDIDLNSAIYEVPVKQGVTYQDVVDSLKSISEGMNFVNPANFPIGEHMKIRGVDPQGIKEVHSFCNLSMGTEIILDHPEFLVFAPCRIAVYEKKNQLYLGLDRPTFDLKSVKNPSERAIKSAQELEDALIQLMEKASRGDF
ncbi:MAG: hypothetical protein B7X98_00305 [Methylophilaceae bacterium 17-43-7]|jgi:uncharacterized protein (DUF302 family)|nr:MAG: hypothetical protein B7Y48_08470 [Methylophilales bacterium 28-44-11]OYZ71049.1 MAG: hypothetical protein B7X98_00305 [Methylophilaceae bacterium 17-43-7]